MNSRFWVENKAFTPGCTGTTEEKAFDSSLRSLYGEEPVYDHQDIEYRKQIETLIDAFFQCIPPAVLDSDERIRPGVDRMKNSLRSAEYTAGSDTDQKRYYTIYKKNLESIFLLIAPWESEKRWKFILNFGEKIIVCAAGAFTQLEHTLYELTVQPTVDSWLAEFRKNILHQWAESYIAEHKIDDGLSIHVHSQCLKASAAKKWHVPGAENIEWLPDQYERQVKLSEKDLTNMEDFFLEEYAGEAIIQNISMNIGSYLSSYKDKYLKYDVRHDALRMPREVLGGEADLNDYLELSEDNAHFKIKDIFWNHLDQYTEKSLEQQGYIKPVNTAPNRYFVEKNVLTLVRQEKERLKKKYGAAHERVLILNGITEMAKSVYTEREDHEVIPRTIESIKLVLSCNPQLDIHRGWAKKFGLILLNTLMTAPAFIPFVIKYALMGSCFFSLKGKTSDTLDKALHRLETHRP